MSTSLYWKPKIPADNRLPLKLKRAMEKHGLRHCTIDFLVGFCEGLDNEKDRESVGALIDYMENHGSDAVEFEIRE
jgi:hypothetical protein